MTKITREEFDKLKSRVDERAQEVFLLWCAVFMLTLKASGTYDIGWGWIVLPMVIMGWQIVAVLIVVAFFAGALDSISPFFPVTTPPPAIMHPWHQ